MNAMYIYVGKKMFKMYLKLQKRVYVYTAEIKAWNFRLSI